MHGTSAGMKNLGRCGEVAVVGRWPLVDVRLYFSMTRKSYVTTLSIEDVQQLLGYLVPCGAVYYGAKGCSNF